MRESAAERPRRRAPVIAREIMPRRKTGDANGGQKSPGPKKSAKVNKITTRSARAATEKRSATARRREQTKGRKTNSFAHAMGLIPRRLELLLRHPSTKRFVQINGDAEEGVPEGMAIGFFFDELSPPTG